MSRFLLLLLLFGYCLPAPVCYADEANGRVSESINSLLYEKGGTGGARSILRQHLGDQRQLHATTFPIRAAGAPTWEINDGETSLIASPRTFLTATGTYPNTVLDTRYFSVTGAQVEGNEPFEYAGGVVADNYTGSNAAPIPVYHFRHDGRYLDFRLSGKGDHRLWINGEACTLNYEDGGVNLGGSKVLSVDFGSRAIRQVAIEYGARFFWVKTEATANISAAPITSLKLDVIGDSFTEENGATSPNRGWASNFAHHLGCWDVCSLGSGGTGYINVSGDRDPFIDRLANDLRADVDVIVFAGGINDDGEAVGFRAAVLATFQEALTLRPNALIVALSPFAASQDQVALTLAKSAVVKEEVERVGGIFLDLLQPPLWTGNGSAASPSGTGTSDIYVQGGAGGPHPTQAGHEAIGRRAADLMLEKLFEKK